MGSRTSHVAKLFLQKYWHGMPDFLSSSSKRIFIEPHQPFCFKVRKRPARGLLVLSCQLFPGWANISFPLKYLAVLAPPGLSHGLPVPSAGLSRLWGFFEPAVLGCLGYHLFLGIRRGSANEGSICPYQALCLCRISWSCCPLHGCEKIIAAREGMIKPPTVA